MHPAQLLTGSTCGRRRILTAVVAVLVLVSTGWTAPQVLDVQQIESIRLLGANHAPLKVLVALLPDRNLDFVVSLIETTADIERRDGVPAAERCRVRVISTAGEVARDFATLRGRLSAAVMRDYVELERRFTLEGDTWMQDIGEIGVVKLKNQPKSQLLVFDSGRGEELGALPAVLATLWNSHYLKNPSQAELCGDFGGNIEVLPNDVLVMGNTSSKELRGFLGRLGYRNRLVVLETDWLEVGHVDEYLSIIPNPRAPNGYTLVKANPRLALQLIARCSRDELRKIPDRYYRSLLIGVRDALCRRRSDRQRRVRTRHGLPKPSPASARASAAAGMTPTVSQPPPAAQSVEFEASSDDIDDLDLDSPDSEPAGSGTDGEEPSLSLDDDPKPYSGEVQTFIKRNLALAALIDTNVDHLCRRVREITGENERQQSIISFPALFESPVTGSDKCLAYVPGSVNQLALRRHLLIPDPKVEAFRRHIREAVTKLGLQAHFLDSSYYHDLFGGIHCATNVMRHPSRTIVSPRFIAAPQPVPPAPGAKTSR